MKEAIELLQQEAQKAHDDVKRQLRKLLIETQQNIDYLERGLPHSQVSITNFQQRVQALAEAQSKAAALHEAAQELFIHS